MWLPNYTKEYEDWFTKQVEEDQIVITAKVKVLSEFGPNLGRPLADTVKGSKHKNLKELRFNTRNKVFRIIFIFNKVREYWLIIGGNKKGKNEDDFYKKIIKQAEEIMEKNPEILEGEK